MAKARTIDVEGFHQHLLDNYCDFCKCDGCDECLLHKTMIELEQYAKEHTESPWISCEDRLPEIRTPVLIKCKCRYGKNVGSVKISMGMWRERLTESEIEWIFYGNLFDKDGIGARVHLSGWDVIAWMPMPDAYDPPEKE